jgi:hypothetical protein
MERLRRAAVAAAVSGSVVGAVFLAAPATALAYGDATGNGAVYQVEISANSVGKFTADPSSGGGVWLWIELDKDGTGDYTGSDCFHDAPGGGAGAIADRGDVTWSTDGTTLTILGVTLAGFVPVTITVPAAYGHYRTTSFGDIIHVDFPGFPTPEGFAEVQIAP